MNALKKGYVLQLRSTLSVKMVNGNVISHKSLATRQKKRFVMAWTTTATGKLTKASLIKLVRFQTTLGPVLELRFAIQKQN